MNKQKTLALGGVAVLAGIAGASAQGVQTAPLFQIGGVDVRPHATYSAVYDDNIFLEHKDKGSLNRAGNAGRDHDFIHTFTPGLKLNAGDAFARQTAYFAANYEAAVTRFTDYSGANTVDHNGEIAIGGNLQKLKVDLSQTLESRSDADTANLAAGGRVKRKTWTTKVNSKYEVSEKTSAGLDLNQTIGDYEAPLFDTVDRSASLWMDYQVLPKVKMGLGAVVGYLQVDGVAGNHNANSVYEQGLVRLGWAVSDKLTIQGSAGIENRNVQESGATDPVTAVFSLGASWKASEKTAVDLTASRGTRASNAGASQLNEETSVVAAIRQALVEGVSLSLQGGYIKSHYKAINTAAAGTVRDDDYVFVKPSLNYRFMERAQASVYYQYRRNDSDAVSNLGDFYNNQIGLELSYKF
jgi:hypothetical protein